jgi:hypothetical protein
MATDKRFAVAGVSTLNGKTKIRFANDAMRVKMTKAEIAAHMVEVGFGSGNPAVQAAIKDLAKKNPVGKTAKAPAVEAETVTA